jgi:hypothetical protein
METYHVVTDNILFHVVLIAGTKALFTCFSNAKFINRLTLPGILDFCSLEVNRAWTKLPDSLLLG